MARWLCSSRRLWFLDEPVTALDQAAVDLLVEIVETHLQRGGAVLYATHQPLAIATKTTLTLTGVTR